MRHVLKDIAFAINGKSIGRPRLRQAEKQGLRPYLKGESLAKDISHNMTEKSITLIINMEKFIAQNEPLSNRPQILEDSCDAVEEIWYNHPFTEDELNEIKTKLADTSIDIAELEQEKADWMESYKSRLKPLNTAKAKYLDQIKRKSEDIKDKCYKFLDHENKEANYYNGAGELVYFRRMQPQEMQKSIFNINRKTGTES